MPWDSFGRFLILTGLLIAAVGFFLIFFSRVPYLGRLPGDIVVQKKNFSFYFPWVSCLVVSIFLTIILNLIFRK